MNERDSNGGMLYRLGNLYMSEQCSGLYVLFGMIVCVIIAYFAIVNLTVGVHNDVLNQTVFTVGDSSYSWWPITHLFTFLIIGFVFPSCTLPALMCGVVWEIVEELTSMALYYVQEPSSSGSIQYERWWSGSYMDVAMDCAGFFIGKAIRMEADMMILAYAS